MIRFLLLLSLTLLPLSGGFAAEVDVYMGEAVVEDQSERERQRALPKALRQALSRYSGVRETQELPGFEAASESAASILVTSYYRSVQRIQADGSTLDEQRLVARFFPRGMDELARSLGLPLWQPGRNPLEVWVVIDDGRERRILPLEFAYLRTSLDEEAEQRGQPLFWPEPDEEGMYPVDMQLLWGGYTEDLASLNGVGVLILAARREGFEWMVRTNLGFGGENRAWRNRNLDLETALVDGMHQAIDQVALLSAIQASDLGTWQYQLTIGGLRNASDYQVCLAYLQAIGIVDSVSVVSARPETVTFELQLSALPRHLEESFEADAVLQPGENGAQFDFVGDP
jgi:hypothetical protein